MNVMMMHKYRDKETEISIFSLFFSSKKRFFDDGKELVVQIQDKQKELPEDVGDDFSKAESFHRVHAAFERDISSLGKQVRKTKNTPVRPEERRKPWKPLKLFQLGRSLSFIPQVYWFICTGFLSINFIYFYSLFIIK